MPTQYKTTLPVHYYAKTQSTYGLISTRLRLLNFVTPKVAYIFCNGQCHGLALALHKFTGWPIVGVFNLYGTNRETIHYAVVTPESRLADIGGVYNGADYGRRKTNPETLVNYKRAGWLPASHEFAEHYAPIVLREIERQRTANRWDPDWYKRKQDA